MIGDIISHYKISAKLGEGGMGVVYKAEDTKLDREVAIKFLSSQDISNDISHQRFEQEAKSAAALSHPNICTVHDYDEHEGRPFLVMEYLEGETLREKLENGPLAIEKAIEYARQIAEALDAAHEQGIIHRDIKPANIMVDESGQVKVMDFGLAKLEDAAGLTQTGSTVGTMAYMSPEQIKGEDVDRRSDIFSLGVVFYEMCAGVTPFRGEHQAAMTYAIVNEEPEPLSDYKPYSDDQLEKIIQKCLSKDPEERHDDAQELIRSLDKITAKIEDLPEKKSDGESSIEFILPNIRNKDRVSGSLLLIGAATVIGILILGGWWFAIEKTVDKKGNPNNNDVVLSDSLSKVEKRTVAVLPFSNLGGFGKAEPLSKGIHEDLITRLSNIADIRVKSRTSVSSLSQSDISMPDIADSLGVQWIVVGGVMEMGDQVKVNARLVDPESDSNIWADNYLRDLTAENFFDIQGDITREIAKALETELSNSEKQRITGSPTENLKAYRLYVQGRSALNTRTKTGMVNAIQSFRRAIAQDSSYALAWAGLADAIGLSPLYGPDTLTISQRKYRDVADRALELDPSLAEAHASLGYYYYDQRKVPKALKHLEQAVELKPSYAQGHHWLALIYLTIGRIESANEHVTLAINLNPGHQAAHGVLNLIYLAEGEFEKARKHAERYPRIGEEAPYFKVDLLNHEMRWDQVRQLSHNVLTEEKAPRGYWYFNLGLAALGSKDTVTTRNYLEKAENTGKHFEEGLLYAALGEYDEAISAWNNVEKWTVHAVIILRYYYPDIIGPLRNTPKYDKLINKINSSWGLNSDGSIPDDIIITNP